MNNPWETSTEVVRFAIADRVRELGGDDEAINNIAVCATYAMSCAAVANAQAG
jgi:hypothetical protein